MQTIYALSSGAPTCGVAVIRVSGPMARDYLERLCGVVPQPRRLARATLRHSDGERLDDGMVVWFPSPHSFTGEDVGEFHVHGSRAVVDSLLSALAALGGRMAEPGEFTRRAFSNGKMDLSQVEGFAELLAAETRMQQRQALGLASGALQRQAEAWREEILSLRAEIEARLDFADEDDVPEALAEDFALRVDGLRRELEATAADAARGERMREGFRVALMGAPNVGKSTLLNALARRDVAIVTSEPGTTRDILEVSLDLSGYPVVIADTAGLRESDSVAERAGQERALRWGESADLVLWLDDGRKARRPAVTGPVLLVNSKFDLRRGDNVPGYRISAHSGEGITDLLDKVAAEAAKALGTEPVLVSRRRHAECLDDAVVALGAVAGSDEEVAADLLRMAGDAIGRISGRVGIEDVLDRLFGEFCIGK